MQGRITQIMIYVADMQRSIAFYRDIMGLTLTSESEQWSEFDAGDFTMALHWTNVRSDISGEVGVPAGRAEITFQVDDLDGACAEIAQRGGAIDGPKEMEGLDIRVAYLRDPDGMAIQLIS